LNWNISNIRYNLINLPSQITFSDGNTIDYEYGSDGRKLCTVHQTGSTILTDDYYPFGATFTTSTGVQPYKYNGRELERKRKGGLDWYDYGARQYDAMLGRWNVVDPMGENFYFASMYNYCKNNPVNRIDIGGKWAVAVHVNENRKKWLCFFSCNG